ncbi:MAG: head decoration protein [Pseudomonadota bacterium]
MKITNALDANGFHVTNAADPVNPQDLVTKAYADALAQGYKWKDPVRAATTANITLSGAQTIDGVAVVAGDRVLVKNQTTASGNGLYLAATGAWSRATDFDLASELVGASVFVSEGTTLGNSVWVMTTDGPITLGTTSQVWTQTNAGTSYTAGTGISISGSVISIDTSVTARKVSAAIGDGSSTTLTVTHNLNTQDVAVSVYDAATRTGVICDWVANGVNTVQLTFGTAPTTGQYRVAVVG